MIRSKYAKECYTQHGRSEASLIWPTRRVQYPGQKLSSILYSLLTSHSGRLLKTSMGYSSVQTFGPDYSVPP